MQIFYFAFAFLFQITDMPLQSNSTDYRVLKCLYAKQLINKSYKVAIIAYVYFCINWWEEDNTVTVGYSIYIMALPCTIKTQMG